MKIIKPLTQKFDECKMLSNHLPLSLSFASTFSVSTKKNSENRKMAAARKVFGIIPVRLMLSKNVSSCLVRNMCARSVFAAATRTVSSQEQTTVVQNSHTCSRVCSCALHQYTKGQC